jgi:acetyl-CoA carboxylase biotin carboxyl carrier protein
VVVIRAPMLGTFYRAPSPGEKPFVEVGQRVRADDTVCLIEVMKLFNSIRAGVDGEVVEILADNGGLVEFDQPLIFIAPGAKVQADASPRL